jgi:hypothetical protein
LAEELRLTDFVDGSVGMLHDVELVVDDLALRRPVLDTGAAILGRRPSGCKSVG